MSFRILKNISVYIILKFIIIFFMIILFLFGCNYNNNSIIIKEEAWNIVKNYLINDNPNYLKITFPDKYENFFVEFNKNKLIIEGYFMYIPGSCCRAMVKKNFSCVVEYKYGKYYIISFEYKN